MRMWAHLILASAALASSASAHPFVLTATSGTVVFSSTPTFSNDEWNINIRASGGTPAVFTLTTDDPDTVGGKIEVECDVATTMTLDQSGTGDFAFVRWICEPDETASPYSFSIERIQISGTLGGIDHFHGPEQVEADAIGEVLVTGDITSSIFVGDRGQIATSRLETVTSGGGLGLYLEVYNGSIGSINVAGDLSGMFMQSREGIDSIEADSMFMVFIYADYPSGDDGQVGRVVCREGGFSGGVGAHRFAALPGITEPGVFIAGDLAASITMTTDLEIPIEIEGDMSGMIMVGGDCVAAGATRGDITIHGDVLIGGGFDIDGNLETIVRIGGALVGGGTIGSLATGPGQVIINALDDGGTWLTEALLEVESEELDPQPHYSNTGLVGGVGLVPFATHDLDCIPEHGGPAAAFAFTVTLAFYGPVTWDSGFPFTVEYSTDNGSTWTSDNANWTVLAGKGTRKVHLMYFDASEPSYIPAGRDYRVRPMTTGSSTLICDKLLTTSDVPVDYFTYLFYTP